MLDASRHSMGMDISEIDLLNIHAFAERVIKLAEYRVKLQDYLHNKMGLVAPNLQSLIGDAAARKGPLPCLRLAAALAARLGQPPA